MWYDVTKVGSAYAKETDGDGQWRHRPLIVRQDLMANPPPLGLLLPGEHHGIGEWIDGPAPPVACNSLKD